MLKHILFVLLTVAALNPPVHAQQVIAKNGVVSLDGKPLLTYEITKNVGQKILRYCALGEDETLFEAHYCNNWSSYGTDDYRHYHFPVGNQELILPRRKKFRFRFLLPQMVNEGVLDMEGYLDPVALEKFIARHNVPLPQSFGPRVHRLPIIQATSRETHRWKHSPDYDTEKKKWKVPDGSK